MANYDTIAVKSETKRLFDRACPDGMTQDAFLRELLDSSPEDGDTVLAELTDAERERIARTVTRELESNMSR